MNNACPSCGAVYAVTAKDIGRKLKCKKCQSALIVADSGLEIDGPGGPPPSLPAHEESFASAVADDGEGDDSEEVVTKKSKKGKKDKPPRQPTDYKALAAQATAFSSKFGGISTLLFGFGVFLVIWFVFQSKIGEASAMSDAMYVHKLELEKKKHPRLKNSRKPEKHKPRFPRNMTRKSKMQMRMQATRESGTRDRCIGIAGER
jgi:predicted Zn finger-like uncharacterized protein